MFPLAKIYAFEPTPSTFRTLTRMVEHEPRIRPFRVALADRNGTASINNNVLPSTNSLLESGRSADAADMFWGRGDIVSRSTIETVALDDFAARNMGHCDFLKLDLQGYEVNALRGARRLLREQIRAVVSEVRFKALYENDKLFGDIDASLAENGFRLSLISEVTHQPKDGTAYEANALWVRDARVLG
jgi:FkbM family methyltransferase